MNQQRDSESTVRGWVREGAERAPDWAVSAALAEIERTPQRPAWRTRLREFERRLGPTARVLGIAAVMILVVVPLALVRMATVPPTVGRTIQPADLQTIVVWEDTMPPGWTLDNLTTNADFVAATPVRTMLEKDFLASPALDGLQGGRYTDFSGTDAVFMSWAVLFGNSRQAGAAFDAYTVELGSAAGWALGDGEAVDLGDHGLVFTGETFVLMGSTPTDDPVPMQIYLWRVGNVVLATAGWFEFDPQQLRLVADGMDARAR
jgi:hypothetical protein